MEAVGDPVGWHTLLAVLHAFPSGQLESLWHRMAAHQPLTQLLPPGQSEVDAHAVAHAAHSLNLLTDGIVVVEGL